MIITQLTFDFSFNILYNNYMIIQFYACKTVIAKQHALLNIKCI